MRILAKSVVAGLISSAILITSAAMTPAQAAGDKLQGEWESADGTFKLEFQGKGKCYFSAGPMTTECTYQQNGKKTLVKIPDDDDPLVLTANDDGSMSSPPDSFMPMRMKRKKP